LPPCSSIIFFEIKSPRPVPCPDVAANFENNFGAISVSIPEPLSFTETITSCSMLLFFKVPTFSCSAIDIVPSFVNLRALASRLEITWFSLSLSASIIIDSLLQK
jgi:hypothetical protein